MKVKINKIQGPKYNLKIKKSIDGRIFVMDHPDIDIVIVPKESKIITFPKDTVGEEVYGSQDIFFKHLVKVGVVMPESIQGGAVYFSIEGVFPESKNGMNAVDLALLNIANFLEEEKEYFEAEENYKREVDEKFYAPNKEESTEFGEIPHSEKKGSIPRGQWPWSYGGSLGVTY